MKLINILFVASLLALLGCTSTTNENGETLSWIHKKGHETGINFSNNLYFDVRLNIIEYLYYYNGGGVGIGDINNDGLEDIYFSANQSPDRLYLNLGGLEFKDITAEAGLRMDSTWSTGVTMDDVNGDGFLDIYVCKIGALASSPLHNLLYINNGDGTFHEKSEQLGLDFSGYSTQSSFFDYDGDDDLDMYLLNHSSHSIRSYGDTTKRRVRDRLSGDILFENKLNETDGKFVDVTEQAGIYGSALGYGLAVITSDVNGDGFVDIYVGNDFHENDYLYINNGNKKFTESMSSAMVSSSQFTMGVDITDINNDGLMDIFTTDMMPGDGQILLKSGGEDSEQVRQIKKDFGFEDQYARNHLHINLNNQTFAEIAYLTETFATDWSWSVLIQDFNNDGNNDLFVTNGIVKRPNDLDYINFINEVSLRDAEPDQKEVIYKSAIEKMPSLKIKNLLFINEPGDGIIKFQQRPLGDPSYSNGAAYSDLDNDGDLDLVINNIDEQASIIENISAPSMNFVSFQLRGNEDHPISKGSKIIVYAGGHIYFKEYTTTRGFQSSSSHKIHFGLGKNQKIDSVKVIWPDRNEQILDYVSVNQHHTIKRTDSDLRLTVTNKYIVESFSLELLPHKHNENAFIDWEDEKLIPEKISREGPAIAVDDFNQDGRNDIFIGGAVYQEPQIFISESNGSYTPRKVKDFVQDANYEDVAAVSFDFDNDGDMDLYVVSGGNDTKELDTALEDRLYLNDGSGNFIRHTISLPHTNGGAVDAGDYDGDGYIDLFVGGRSIPGSYGLSPYSFILKNIDGKYFDIAFKERFGMISDAHWIDLNVDGHLDLVMAGDWMPILVYTNSGDGDFINETTQLGLSNTNGLWNAIDFADFNNDGHLDIIAANAGQNFKWKANDTEPVNMYIHDFNGTGQIEPIIFNYYFGKYIPFATRDQLAEPFPFIKKKFPSYESFSLVSSLEDLTGVLPSDVIETKAIKELRSMVYIYDSGVFKGRPLCQDAQLSSIQDFSITENQKNHPEVLFVGNHMEFIHNLGASGSNSGGILSDFNSSSNKFESYHSLPLPFDLNPRKIVPLNSDSFLISVNDGYQYILTRK